MNFDLVSYNNHKNKTNNYLENIDLIIINKNYYENYYEKNTKKFNKQIYYNVTNEEIILLIHLFLLSYFFYTNFNKYNK